MYNTLTNFFRPVCFYVLDEFGAGLSSRFSLRILVAGERSTLTGEYLKEAVHLNRK